MVPCGKTETTGPQYDVCIALCHLKHRETFCWNIMLKVAKLQYFIFIIRVSSGTCPIDLSPQWFYITDRSKSILRMWFHLFYVLESNFVLFEPYLHFHILFKLG